MVSNITHGRATDRRGRPFRRRAVLPALILVIALALVGVVVWSVALGSNDDESVAVDCNQPTVATPSTSGPAPATTAAAPASTAAPKLTAASRDDMLTVAPAALTTFSVRVLNASTARGAARTVSDDLIAQGFTPTPDSAFGDDPLYPNQDLNCVAQIRFGPAGKASAAAVWLAIPCAQLVDDGRAGTSIDVALGEQYKAREQSQDAQAALEALRSADPKDPKTGVDPSLVKAVHSASC
ncbi:envelope integrity protein Cei [Gordonia sp. CPCC 205333]|uniref:envelope integrity protein Cei n=1 Tax=Gordonia sp. CPCC 205333 TaxID=3140790 RepID=UPI003AF367AA